MKKKFTFFELIWTKQPYRPIGLVVLGPHNTIREFGMLCLSRQLSHRPTQLYLFV